MKAKIALLLLAVCVLFSGCGAGKPKCTVEIVTNHSQYIEEEGGVVSGTFSEAFTVTEGDIFYESSGGKWILNPENGEYKEVIAEITAIDDKGVTAMIYGEETLTLYGRKRNIDSEMVIYDGPSYDYVMTVSEYSE